MTTKHSNSFNDNQRQKRQNVDSGYSESFDQRCYDTLPSKWQAPSTPLHIRTDNSSIKSGASTPTAENTTVDEEFGKRQFQEQLEKRNKHNGFDSPTNGINNHR